MRILILLLLLIPSVCMARKYKLLVINRDNITREIVTIHESGGYYDLAKVLWDERVDGPLLDIVEVQGSVRTDDAITHSQAQLNIYNAREATRSNDRNSKRSAKNAVLLRLNISQEDLDLILDRN